MLGVGVGENTNHKCLKNCQEKYLYLGKEK